jgi:hypothetical protein
METGMEHDTPNRYGGWYEKVRIENASDPDKHCPSLFMRDRRE